VNNPGGTRGNSMAAVGVSASIDERRLVLVEAAPKPIFETKLILGTMDKDFRAIHANAH
jgi:hypothetical protein